MLRRNKVMICYVFACDIGNSAKRLEILSKTKEKGKRMPCKRKGCPTPRRPGGHLPEEKEAKGVSPISQNVNFVSTFLKIHFKESLF